MSQETLSELQQLQRDHEKRFWDGSMEKEPEYTRHTLEHLAKLIGKLGNVVEPREHGLEPDTGIIREQVIPDLLYFAMGLAEKFDVDLGEAFKNRLKQNAEKIEERRKGSMEKG